MIVKTEVKPKPVCAESDADVVQPLICTTEGELLVHQVNQPEVLALSDLLVDPDGTLVIRSEQPVDIVHEAIDVVRTVKLDAPVECRPVTVANMPHCVRIQDSVDVVQVPHPVKVAVIDFEGNEGQVLSGLHNVYAVHFTAKSRFREDVLIRIVGVTGEMFLKEFTLNLLPSCLQIEDLTIICTEYVKVGGYVLYD